MHTGNTDDHERAALRMGLQTVVVLTTLTLLSLVVKRHKWAGIKTRKLVYNPPPSNAVKGH